jgi:hypothetical protein
LNSSLEKSFRMSSPPFSIDYIESLKAAQKNLYRYGGPVFVVIGTVSGILDLIVFTQKSLRKNPCSIYFTAYNIAVLFLIYTSFLPLTLEIGYNIIPATYNLFLCRLRLYTTFLFNCLCPFYFILASFDRVIVTSPHARTRRKSTDRLAYRSIVIGTLCWISGLCHVLIFSDIIQLITGDFVCYVQLGWYSMAISYGSLIKEILIPLLMIIFGLWSIRNIRNVRRTALAPSSISEVGNQGGTSLNSVRSRDRQLILMLLVDITIHIFFSFIMAISLMYEQITWNRVKTVEGFYIEMLIKSVAMFTAHVPFCINSYANLLVSKAFRREVKELLLWKRVICIRQQR